jgi:hypothetical protein
MIRFEQTRESFERFRFPGAQLFGMHAALGSDAGHALFFFRNYSGYLVILSGAPFAERSGTSLEGCAI